LSERLPNLLIAGVTKAGTTSLFSYLVQHDDICGSTLKETEYFSKLLYPEHELAPLREYARYFRHCRDERYVLEATPNYWYAGERLLDTTETMLGSPRYIISLRNPVDRFWSDFTYMKSKVLLPLDLSAGEYLSRCEERRSAGTEFTEANRYYRTLSTGFYVEHLPKWIDRLGDRLRIVFFEDLVADPGAVVNDVFDWLGLAPMARLDLTARNTTNSVRSQRFQVLAHAIAHPIDRVIRRYPKLKQRFVDAYEFVNRGAPREELLDDATRARLDDHFAQPNRALRATLAAAGYHDVPEWLQA
jgi:hypothetical protein